MLYINWANYIDYIIWYYYNLVVDPDESKPHQNAYNFGFDSKKADCNTQ